MEPQFEPVYTPPKSLYSNVLVNHLNQHIKPMDEPVDLNVSCERKLLNTILIKIRLQATEMVPGSNIMNSKNGFTKEQLVELAKEQLKVEMESVITIKSVDKFPAISETVLQNVSSARWNYYFSKIYPFPSLHSGKNSPICIISGARSF